MNILSDINFMDFYYNGHYLSEYGGYVGSSDGGLKKYSLLPQRTYYTDKALGYDGNIVFGSYLEPRIFNVPIVFDNIDEFGIRSIAGWLNCPDVSKFYFLDDTLYINCCLDSNASDLDSISGKDGECELQFIANDPYYYNLNPSSYSFFDIKKGNLFPMINAGNVKAFPKITVVNPSNDKFTINVHDINKNIIASFGVKIPDSKDAIEIDSKYCTCIAGKRNLFNCVSGEYLSFPTGVFYLSFDVNARHFKTEFTPRFI